MSKRIYKKEPHAARPGPAGAERDRKKGRRSAPRRSLARSHHSPARPLATMLLTAFVPAPPTPTTTILGANS